MRSMQQQLVVFGTISAFAYRHRETKKNLRRGGRSQDLPDTDFQPAIRQLKYVRQQYTQCKNNTHEVTKIQDNNTIHTRPTTIILPSRHRSSKRSPSVRFPHQNSVRMSLLHHMYHISHPPQVPSFSILKIRVAGSSEKLEPITLHGVNPHKAIYNFFIRDVFYIIYNCYTY